MFFIPFEIISAKNILETLTCPRTPIAIFHKQNILMGRTQRYVYRSDFTVQKFKVFSTREWIRIDFKFKRYISKVPIVTQIL